MFNTAYKAMDRLAARPKGVTLRDSLSLHETVPPLASGESSGTGRYQAVVQIILGASRRDYALYLCHKQ